jgi:hypothetical protein
MTKEGPWLGMEDEPIAESEITCNFCGPSVMAAWDIVTNGNEVVFVCHKHHTVLLEKNLVFAERRIGEETWEEIESYRVLLYKWDLEKYEGKRKTD